MNKKNIIISSVIIFTSLFPYLNAFSFSDSSIKITVIDTKNEIQKSISKSDIFNFYASFFDWKVKDSYKYIKLNFRDIPKDSDLEKSLKKLVYLGLIENPSLKLKPEDSIDAWSFYKISEKVLDIVVDNSISKTELKNRDVSIDDLKIVKNIYNSSSISISDDLTNSELQIKLAIMQDVYNTIKNQHYSKDTIKQWDLIDWAIEWIAKWTNDKHTTYFPPIDSENFKEWLAWEYEWIWAYVDMEKPWILRINSPIPWSPSEKAGLKWGDIVIKVDEKEVTEDNSLTEVVSWIKWPAGTTTLLTIDRNWEILEISVKREKITLTDVDSEKLDYSTYYIRIKSFWDHVSNEFKNSLEEVRKDNNISKIILDLRNNWGWYLEEVAEMLSYIIEKDEKTAVVKYLDSDKIFTSKWYDLIDLNKYKIVVLQNSWTASASEILIGTLKDYFPDITIIWEKSYWKWSVQVMKNYIDGSLLKYTVAKWYTWKTETWIDWKWIIPDIELELDIEKFKDNYDNQLEKAKSIN